MTNAAEQLDYEEVPSGGIGDFVMSDDDFATLERQNTRKEFGDNGIAEFENIAAKMASYGRFGDDRVVHVETGELIVPRKLIDQSPALKESIFQHLREAGIEDPERYVVGSAENSFNPETGLMEFGFFSKIFKGIKKAVKKVGKVLKKAAPIILAIALPYALPALGFAIAPAYAAALGSGIGTLIQGGNIKDAFKAAALTAVTAGALGGAKGAMTEGSSFSEGFSGAFTAPDLAGQAAANLAETPLTDLSKTTAEIDAATSVGSLDTATTSGTLATDAATSGAGLSLDSAANAGSLDLGVTTLADGSIGIPTAANPAAAPVGSNLTQGVNTGSFDVQAAMGDAYATPLPTDSMIQDAMGDTYVKPEVAASGVDAATSAGTIADATRGSASGFLGNLKEAGQDILAGEFRGSLTNLSEAFLPNFQVNNAIKEAAKAGSPHAGMAWADIPQAAKQSYLRAAANAGVSTTQKLMGYAPLAFAAGSAGGFFETEPQEPVGILDRDLQGNMITGADLIDADPEKYQIFPYGNYRRNYMPDYSQTLVASTNPGMAPAYGETGGQVFPRRNGGIMMDEGIPNEDSVRAMLMPGEFVMTTDAVRGAGNGNVDQGIKNMYTVMRGLERRGGAMS